MARSVVLAISFRHNVFAANPSCFVCYRYGVSPSRSTTGRHCKTERPSTLVMSSGPMDEILSWDTLALSRAIQSKKVSCVEVMEATLNRIDAINPQCNAIILLRDREELLAEARLADSSTTSDGWLHGIPTAVKDISNVKGIPTTMGGSRLSKNFVPNMSDFHVDQMIRAGAIVIGKTNSPENGLGSHTYNERWGTTLNPFDLTKSAGGSSGGAGVAVATRMLSFADGTDSKSR